MNEREYSRAPISTSAQLMRQGISSAGHLRNISLGGVFMESASLLPPGSSVRLRFSLPPDTRVVSVLGKVVRVEDAFPVNNRTGMGISFRRASQPTLQAIESYVRRMRRLLRSLKLELEGTIVDEDRIRRLVVDTGLDLPCDPALLTGLVPELLLQFRLRGMSRLRKTEDPDP